MRKAWIYRNDPRWKELRLARLKRGLRFAEQLGDMVVCRIITKEIRRVLLQD